MDVPSQLIFNIKILMIKDNIKSLTHQKTREYIIQLNGTKDLHYVPYVMKILK